jgi:hypothetical protein
VSCNASELPSSASNRKYNRTANPTHSPLLISLSSLPPTFISFLTALTLLYFLNGAELFERRRRLLLQLPRLLHKAGRVLPVESRPTTQHSHRACFIPTTDRRSGSAKIAAIPPRECRRVCQSRVIGRHGTRKGTDWSVIDELRTVHVHPGRPQGTIGIGRDPVCPTGHAGRV